VSSHVGRDSDPAFRLPDTRASEQNSAFLAGFSASGGRYFATRQLTDCSASTPASTDYQTARPFEKYNETKLRWSVNRNDRQQQQHERSENLKRKLNGHPKGNATATATTSLQVQRC
jgi:hypothetical protein